MIFTTGSAFREKMSKDKGNAGKIPIGRAVPANLLRVISTPTIMEGRWSVGGGYSAHDAIIIRSIYSQHQYLPHFTKENFFLQKYFFFEYILSNQILAHLHIIINIIITVLTVNINLLTFFT